jgi:hypothetical protein
MSAYRRLMGEKTSGAEPEDTEMTTPSHDQEIAEEVEAQSENGYNDPIGGLPIA